MYFRHSLRVEHVEDDTSCLLKVFIAFKSTHLTNQDDVLFIDLGNEVLSARRCIKGSDRFKSRSIFFYGGLYHKGHPPALGFNAEFFCFTVNIDKQKIVHEKRTDEIILVVLLAVRKHQVLELEDAETPDLISIFAV